MCKNLLVISLLISFLNADIFEQDCKICHINSTQLTMIMSRYTLKYSSEQRIKEAMIKFLKDPSKTNSAMPLGFLSRFEIKEPTKLDDTQLKEAIDLYYKQFNLSQLIK